MLKLTKLYFPIDDNKAPGIDGFNAVFFKISWEIIKTDVYAGVEEFF